MKSLTFTNALKFIFSLYFLISANTGIAQKIQAGPILFHHSQEEYAVWYMTKGNQTAVPQKLVINGQSINVDPSSISCQDRSCVFQFILNKSAFDKQDSLPMRVPNIDIISYVHNPKNAEHSYLLGSCAFNWTQFGRLFFPGNGFRIFNNMQSVNNRGMIWMGDNLYYLFRQRSSFNHMYSKQKRIRKNRFINAFLQSTPQSAIWDDHDYGSNNSDGSFKNKEVGIKVFQSFWPAPYQEDQQEGNYFTLSDEHAKYYYLDDRFFKSEDFSEGMFGAKQMDWLKEELTNSDKTFNIIISGSQMINDIGNQERFPEFKNEFNSFFEFLNKEQIQGIIFLSGDVHYSALYQRDDLLSYPVHEFTCSPLSSFPNKVGKKDVRYNNKHLLNNKRYAGQCFGKLSFKENQSNINCILSLYNGKADLIWEHAISSDQIKMKN